MDIFAMVENSYNKGGGTQFYRMSFCAVAFKFSSLNLKDQNLLQHYNVDKTSFSKTLFTKVALEELDEP